MEKYENLVEIIAENLIYYRKKASLTQSQLAEKLNYSDKSISKWERKEGVPDVLILAQLAKLYGLTVNDFLTTKKKEKVKFVNKYFDKIFITLLAVGIVWLISTIMFVILCFINKEQESFKNWLVFVYSVPFSSILFIIFTALYFRRVWNMLHTSILTWSILTCIFLTLMTLGKERMYLIYFVGVPFQLMIILFYTLLEKRRKNKANS